MNVAEGLLLKKGLFSTESSAKIITSILALCLSLPSFAQDTSINAKMADLDVENTNSTADTEDNPYKVLVNLAFKGRGVNGINSYEAAATHYCKKARDLNDANAYFAMGWMYANGKGLAKDENVAALFYIKAAEQGHEAATKSLKEINADQTKAKTPACLLPDPIPEVTTEAETVYTIDVEREAFYEKGPIYNIVKILAPSYKIDPDLAMAFIKVESNFNPRATSPKNAQGLMQLIPETAARFHVKDPYDPEDNIRGGLAYLEWLLAYFEGDVRLVAAAYNAGENAVDRYKGIPPYPETRKYVTKIYNLYRKSYHPFREDLLLGKRSTTIQLSRNP